MTTRLTDVIVPEIFFPYMLKKTTANSKILNSGILRRDKDLQNKLKGGGRTFNVPFWRDLEDNDSNIASDNPNERATPDKITALRDVAVRHYRTKAWSSMAVAGELAGSDPMEAIGGRVADWWGRNFQKTLLSTLKGVFADNAANNGGDMIVDRSNAPVQADRLISAGAVLTAKQTMGDAADTLSMLIMHSIVYTRLQSQNVIEFIPASESKIKIPTYLGYRVVTSDAVDVEQVNNQNVYSTYLVGRNAIAFAESMPPHAVAIKTEEDAGNGAGMDILWTRRQFAMHPYGVRFTDIHVAGEFPGNAELEDPQNWQRAYPERKQIALALLKTHG